MMFMLSRSGTPNASDRVDGVHGANDVTAVWHSKDGTMDAVRPPKVPRVPNSLSFHLTESSDLTHVSIDEQALYLSSVPLVIPVSVKGS
jgi:hypothetical protein